MNLLIRYKAQLPIPRKIASTSIIPTIQFPFPYPFSSSAAVKSAPTAKSISNPPPQDNPDLGNLCKAAQLRGTLGVSHTMESPGIPLDLDAYASLLQACSDMKSLIDGKVVHARILIDGLDQNVFLGTKLVTMYVSCRNMVDARIVLDRLLKRNLKLWNVMIRGYASDGFPEEALALYYQMLEANIHPDNFTFPFVLKACAALSALQEGKEIHYHVVRTGFESDVFVGTALIDMYAKCRTMGNARHVFDKMSARDVVSWNAMIAGYAQNEDSNEALELFRQMQRADIKPSSITMVSVLLACANLAALEQGKWVHNYIVRSGFESDVSVGNALVSMYAKCGSVEVARPVFDKISEKNVVSWNTMIAGYGQNGHADQMLKLFLQMELEGIKPDPVTIVSVLPVCAGLESLLQGKKGTPRMVLPMRP